MARDRSGIQFLVDDSRVNQKKMVDSASRYFEARIYFRSFYGADEDLKLRINLDFKEFDAIILPIQTRKLIHSYSDASACQADLRCVKLEELLASKMRALLQRRHSPDLYDFVHSLFFQKALAISRREVLTTFLKQTIYELDPSAAKGLPLQLPFEVIRGFWNEYLACPKLSLFSFDDARSWFASIVEDIFSFARPQPAYAGGRGAFRGSFYSSAHRDVILEAGRLTRLLRVVYDGYERVVEPYSLTFKRRQDGVASEYFYVWDRSGGRSGSVGIKSLFADKVQSVAMTEESFEPRFAVELAKGDGGYFSSPFSNRASRPISIRPRGVSQAAARSPYGITYTFACPYCDKRFKRHSYDTKLNEHKDKYGNRCFGRMGFLV